MVIAHAGVFVSDYAKSKAFYTTVLATLGYTQNMEYGEAAGFNDGKNTDLWISKSESLTPGHIAFEAKNAGEVDAFFKAALEAGAKDNGAPGYRTEYWPGYYAAFIYDFDGNNIEAVWFDYSKVSDDR